MPTDPAHDASSLALDADVMRQLGYRTIDMLVDRITGPQGPVVNAESPAELHRRLSMPPPEQPAGFDEILDDLERDVLPYVARLAHPGYLAYIPGEGTWPGALGDLISSALNIDACWWLGASGPAALELAVLDWFRQWVGYPAEAGGVLVSGGSAANLTALACAREALMGEMDARAVLYMSDQAHSSLARAARVLGFGPDQVRVILSDHVGAHASGRAGGRDRRRPGRRQASAAGRRQRGQHGRGCDRPVRRAVADLPRARCLAARGRRLRRLRLPDGARARGAGRHGAGRLDHARPAQVAVSAGRGGRPAGARRRPPAPLASRFTPAT